MVVLLIHGDGINGAQDITDSSGKNTMLGWGNAQLSITYKKFGTASVQFDGNGDYFTSSSLSNFDFGALDLTVEAWVYILVSANNTVVGVWDYGSFRRSLEIRIDSSNCSGIRHSVNGSENNFYYSSTALLSNKWHHIAYVRSGNNLIGYLDRVQVVTTSIFSSLFFKHSGAISNWLLW